ncbi:MAG TPA: transposase [Candidatus Thorarchaeota archaeon]|nr:MAG: hypothetical protein DRO93_11415 [Candidatus Thorarchaeota archaeon]HDD67243.1 transposase [Candidatus Thorarchaeota archaeon]
MCGVQMAQVGEYDRRDCLYCPHCGSELHADVNAARNIIEVQQPSTVAGWTGT